MAELDKLIEALIMMRLVSGQAQTVDPTVIREAVASALNEVLGDVVVIVRDRLCVGRPVAGIRPIEHVSTSTTVISSVKDISSVRAPITISVEVAESAGQ